MIPIVTFTPAIVTEITILRIIIAVLLLISLALREILRHRNYATSKTFRVVLNVSIVVLLALFLFGLVYQMLILL